MNPREEDRILSSKKPLRKAGGVSAKVAINLFLLVYAITAIYPLIWMIFSSLKTQPEFMLNIFALPSRVNLTNYIKIFQVGTVFRAFLNSIFASVVSIIFILVLAFVIAYILARYQFRGRNVIYIFFMFGLTIPIYALMVPLFLEFKYLGMLDNQFTIIPPMVAFELSGGIFLFESYIRSIPIEVEEAAFMDGASTNTILTQVLFPMCTPIIVTYVVLSFLGTWNSFAFPLVLLESQQYKTIPLWLNTFQGERTVDYTGKMTGLVIASIPVIVIYLLFRDKIMEGMIAGSVRG
jgi:raffinose/stachyose/melibiose transport system permease protein